MYRRGGTRHHTQFGVTLATKKYFVNTPKEYCQEVRDDTWFMFVINFIGANLCSEINYQKKKTSKVLLNRMTRAVECRWIEWRGVWSAGIYAIENRRFYKHPIRSGTFPIKPEQSRWVTSSLLSFPNKQYISRWIFETLKDISTSTAIRPAAASHHHWMVLGHSPLTVIIGIMSRVLFLLPSPVPCCSINKRRPTWSLLFPLTLEFSSHTDDDIIGAVMMMIHKVSTSSPAWWL